MLTAKKEHCLSRQKRSQFLISILIVIHSSRDFSSKKAVDQKKKQGGLQGIQAPLDSLREGYAQKKTW